MKNTFSVLFYVKKQQKKSGLLPIMGRITVNKQTTQFFTQLEIDPQTTKIPPTEAIVTARIKEKYGKNHRSDVIRDTTSDSEKIIPATISDSLTYIKRYKMPLFANIAQFLAKIP